MPVWLGHWLEEVAGKTSGTDSALVVLLPVLVGSLAADPALPYVQMPCLVNQSCLCLHLCTWKWFHCSIPQTPQAEQGIFFFILLICNSVSVVAEETTFCAWRGEEERGTNLSWVLVFYTVVLALPWILLATRAKGALVSCEILACFPGALAQDPAPDCAVQDEGSHAESTTAAGGQRRARPRQRGAEHHSATHFWVFRAVP